MAAESKSKDKSRFQRYSFTQAMYNWKPPKKGPERKLGMGLVLLFALVAAMVVYAIYRFV
ncbi:MAG TPA: hypothetical protein VHP35_06655 [Terriglobia bacterium]|jgi:hypothetical protein|nr:hypothetical protein [Terriglobia bacterium]